ncbi:MAG: hypothetical protein FD153_1367 [Rhodospirillaceae bacterium]|nr:MAG: hypothetical protein FD153_1367 [Rhodospirillaceae bacterium]
MSEDEDLIRLSVAEAALRLGVSVDTVRRRIRAKDLKAQRDNTGKWWVLVPTSLPAWDTGGPSSPDMPHPLEPQARRDLFEALKNENDRLWQALRAKDDLIRDLALKLATATLMTTECTQMERDEARAQLRQLKMLIGQMLARLERPS